MALDDAQRKLFRNFEVAGIIKACYNKANSHTLFQLESPTLTKWYMSVSGFRRLSFSGIVPLAMTFE